VEQLVLAVAGARAFPKNTVPSAVSECNVGGGGRLEVALFLAAMVIY
jgi:hypothetical protein